MNKFKEKLYSDNLHNYDYDKLVNNELEENSNDQDTENKLYRKPTNILKNSYTGFRG